MRLGSRRYICTKGYKKHALFLVVAFGIVCCCLLLVCSFFALRTSATKMAKSRAKEIALLTVNRAISEKLSQSNITYSDFVSFTYSADGNITSAQNNLSKISKHSADLAIDIGEAIRGMSKENLSIPIGTLSGVDVLYGMGPDIPLEIKPYGDASAELKTKFYSAGINQTRFEVTAEVSAEISVLMPTIRTAERVKTDVPVISTVVVGAVPDSFTSVDRQGYEFEEDVLELAE